MVPTPNAPPPNTGNAPPHISGPRATWLLWVSIVLFLYTLLITPGIVAVARSAPVTVFVTIVWVVITAVPLVIYVAINGVPALRFVKVRLILLCVISLVRAVLDFYTTVIAMQAF